MAKDFYTTHQVSKFCNVYPSTVINWIKDGLLPAYTTPGGHRRIKKDDLFKLMKKNNMPIPEELIKENKNRVLVIDDDPKILKMISTILSSEDDLEVETANSGFQAGLLISNWLPDIILLDLLMPEMNGFEVAKRLKSDEKTKDITVIAVTVVKDPKEIKKMYACGFGDYISKPFKSQELITKIKKHLLIEQ
ncbi:MAG: response regulator [Candidatus Omnitrophota bacterium]|nr:response regulator [Candidatus Omnitrophota bacterium]